MKTDWNSVSPAGNTVPVSVVILTFNEERNIALCLESCAWCNDVHVLDSGSKDRTCEIARQMGATVHVHPFTSFGEQRNWAIDNIPCKHRWHFHLDADERFTPAIVQEMLREIGPDGLRSRYAAYYVPSKMIFMGKWLRHSAGYPTYQVRLFHSEKCRFIDFGHGQRESCRGEIGSLVNPYLHYSFAKGMADWFSRHNGYSSREAAEAVLVRRDGVRAGGLINRDGLVRRRTLKNLAFYLKAALFFDSPTCTSFEPAGSMPAQASIIACSWRPTNIGSNSKFVSKNWIGRKTQRCWLGNCSSEGR